MADGRQGEELEGVLRVRFFDATPEDVFAIALNGAVIDQSKYEIRHMPEADVGWPRDAGHAASSFN